MRELLIAGLTEKHVFSIGRVVELLLVDLSTGDEYVLPITDEQAGIVLGMVDDGVANGETPAHEEPANEAQEATAQAGKARGRNRAQYEQEARAQEEEEEQIRRAEVEQAARGGRDPAGLDDATNDSGVAAYAGSRVPGF